MRHRDRIDIGAAFVVTGTRSACLRARRMRPLFLIDLAVPRNSIPDSRLENAYLYNVDDSKCPIANLEQRQREARDAEEIVAREVESFGAGSSP